MAAKEETPTRAKKIQPSDFKVSEQFETAPIGFTETARGIVSLDLNQSKNVLIAGYGVRHTEWVIASLIKHFQHHSWPIYGIDNSTLLLDFPRSTFTSLTTRRDQAEEMLEKLAGRQEKALLILTSGGNLLSPIHVEESLREAAARTGERILELLTQVLENQNVRVIFQSARLYEEAALPTSLLEHFGTYVITGKILSRDEKHIVADESQQETLGKAVTAMPAMNSILLPKGGKPQVFQHFRTPVR